jgi:hypothetical protein
LIGPSDSYWFRKLLQRRKAAPKNETTKKNETPDNT